MQEYKNGFEFLKMLKERDGEQASNYSALSRYIAFKARKKGVPITGQFELTPLCNFNCKMCYVHLDPEQLGQSVLAVDTWKELLRQAVEAGMYHANLTGGECLAYPGFEELYLYLHSLGCEIGVLTNGYLLDEKWISFFKNHMPTRIQITLYGSNDDAYERVTGRRAFKTVTENIRKAIEAHLPVALAITPCEFMGDDIFDTVRLAKSFGQSLTVNSVLFPPREETGRSEQQVDSSDETYLRIYQLVQELNGVKTKEIAEEELPPYGSDVHECRECGLRCGGGRAAFVVNWKGTLMPCNRMDMICAYPLKEGFKAAWTKVNQEANRWPQVPECDQCAYREVCNNCAANMLQYAEPGKQPIKLCERTKFFVRCGIRQLPECKEE